MIRKSNNSIALKKITKVSSDTFSGETLKNAASIKPLTALLLIGVFVLMQGCIPKGYKPVLEDFPPVPVTLSSGKVVTIPLLYSESRTVNMFFHADRAVVEAMLVGTPFKLATWVDSNTTTIGLGSYEYGNAGGDIAPYNEVGLIIPVVLATQELNESIRLMSDLLLPVERRKISFYVLNIPASNQDAVDVGIEVWGFTKFLAPIDFSLVTDELGSAVDVTVHDPGPVSSDTILNISGTLNGNGNGIAASSSVTASVLDGQATILYNYVTNATTRFYLTRKVALTLTLGESSHPMVQNMLDMGLDGASPISVSVATNYESILYFGDPM